jgi:hypothetical protein
VVPTLAVLAACGLDVFKFLVGGIAWLFEYIKKKREHQPQPLEVNPIETKPVETIPIERKSMDKSSTRVSIDKIAATRTSTDKKSPTRISTDRSASVRRSIDHNHEIIHHHDTIESKPQSPQSRKKRRSKAYGDPFLDQKEEMFITGLSFNGRVLDRVKVFSDAVFATVSTILVLSLVSPVNDVSNTPSSHLVAASNSTVVEPVIDANYILGQKLLNMWPTYISLILAFSLVSVTLASHVLLGEWFLEDTFTCVTWNEPQRTSFSVCQSSATWFYQLDSSFRIDSCRISLSYLKCRFI